MKIKSMKTLLTVALATVMVIGSTFSVCAKTTETNKGGTGASASASEVAQKEIEAATVAPGAEVKVAGKSVVNTITNIVMAKSVEGAVVTTPKADIMAAFGLEKGQEPKVVMFDLDPKKSYLAMDSINGAVKAINGTFLTALDIDLYAVGAGKKIELKDGSVAMSIGLPKGADTTKTYVMVCVQAKGVTTILEDQDTEPSTITFAVQPGLAGYALVALN